MKNEKNINVLDRMYLDAYRSGIDLICAISGMRPTGRRRRQLQGGDKRPDNNNPGHSTRPNRNLRVCIRPLSAESPKWLIQREGECDQHVGDK